jgi:hypothetical protein
MIIQPNKKLKKSLETKYWKETRKALAKARSSVINMAENADPESLKLMTGNLLEKQPVIDQINKIWAEVGARFGFDTAKKLKSQMMSSEEWRSVMRSYSNERSLLKAQKILSTYQEIINNVIDKIVDQSLNEGLGVAQTRSLLQDQLSEELVKMERYQAQRIAMTEVGSASNTASFEAAKESAGTAKKVWLFIPGKKTFRDNHKSFEDMGPMPMDYEYAPGLKHPGDPSASADEIINCYCSIGYSVD